MSSTVWGCARGPRELPGVSKLSKRIDEDSMDRREFTRDDFGTRLEDSHGDQPRDSHRSDRYGYSRRDYRDDHRDYRDYRRDYRDDRRDYRRDDRDYPRRDDRHDDRRDDRRDGRDCNPKKDKSLKAMKPASRPEIEEKVEFPIEDAPEPTKPVEKVLIRIWTKDEIDTEADRLKKVMQTISSHHEQVHKLEEEIAEISGSSDFKVNAELIEQVKQLKIELKSLKSEIDKLTLQYRKDVEHLNVEKKRAAEEQQRLENERNLLEKQEHDRIKMLEQEKRRIRDEQREAAEQDQLQAIAEAPNTKEEKKKRRAAKVAARGGPTFNFY